MSKVFVLLSEAIFLCLFEGAVLVFVFRWQRQQPSPPAAMSASSRVRQQPCSPAAVSATPSWFRPAADLILERERDVIISSQ